MPIYEYHCTSCGADLEIFQHMKDPALTVCPECKGKLKKIFSPVGIVFKGSGFYATDSKNSASSTSTSSPSSAASHTSDTPAPSQTSSPKPAPSTSSGTPASAPATAPGGSPGSASS